MTLIIGFIVIGTPIVIAPYQLIHTCSFFVLVARFPWEYDKHYICERIFAIIITHQQWQNVSETSIKKERMRMVMVHVSATSKPALGNLQYQVARLAIVSIICFTTSSFVAFFYKYIALVGDMPLFY
nr:hypothetical protein [Tanacetum cinerariifolium]